MNQANTSRWKFVVATAALLLTLPAVAQKRRAVQHPSPAAPPTAVIVTGKVIDAVTGQPVNLATVRLGNRTDRTVANGTFQIKTTIYGQGEVTAERSGYTTVRQTITPTGPLDLTLSMQPTPTVKLRLVDGTQTDVDFESIEFGYVPPFGSYSKSEYDDFCKPDGTTVRVNRTEMARITGPATSETNSACCGGTGTPQKITVTLKTGETTPLYFNDSCTGFTIDLIAREHVSGKTIYTKFSNIAEIVFP